MKHDDLIARLRRAGANANVGLHGHLMHEAADALEAITGDKAVDRGARAMFAWDTEAHPAPAPTWADLSDDQRDVWRSGSRAILDAAAIHDTIGGGDD